MSDEPGRGKRYAVNIDRIVIDGGSMATGSAKAFRRQVTAELERRLARPEVIRQIRSKRRGRVVAKLPRSRRPNGAAGVARQIIQALQNSPSQQ